MSKKLLPLILASLLLLFFNLLFFLWTDAEQRTDADWINYGFLTFSCIVMLWSATNRQTGSGSTFAMTLPWNGIFYVFATFVVAVVATACTFSVKLTLTLQSLVSLIFLIALTVHASANKRTAAAVSERDDRLADHKICIARMKDICQRADGTPAHREIKRLLDTLSGVSLETFTQMNRTADIAGRIDELDSALCSGNSGTAGTIAAAITRTLARS